MKLYDNGVKRQWLQLRDERSADRPDQILRIFCQPLCTHRREPPILSCLLRYVPCLPTRCLVELERAEAQNRFAYSHPPWHQDKWQNNLPKKMKQLMDLDRGLGSPGPKIAYHVLACVGHWNVSRVKMF